MPIKFRCNYCRQFLGISRAQAGGIVDCPTCGRSIRVPLLDGTLQPLPTPEMNMQDAQLARALDELARLANVIEAPSNSNLVDQGGDGREAEDEAENEIPQPIPEPIPIEVPIPPTPITIQAPMQDDGGEPPLSTGAAESFAASMGREQSLLAELASLSPPPSTDGKEAEAPSKFETRSLRPNASLPRISLVIMVAFIAGMMFERFVKALESIGPATRTPAKEVESTDPEPSKQVTGRITYKSADGTSQPDRGARIIAFPLQRSGEARLSVVGFRPADGEADSKIAAATLQAMGGSLATADESGQYRLEVPAGTYHLLVLSHFQQRNDKDPVDPTAVKMLTAYFDKPEELLGRVKHQYGPLKVKGTGDVWDHSF